MNGQVYATHSVNDSVEGEPCYSISVNDNPSNIKGYVGLGLAGLAIVAAGFLACKNITEPNVDKKSWFNAAVEKCVQIRRDEARGNYLGAYEAENDLRSDIRQRKIVNNWRREFEIIERDLDANATKSADYGEPLN